MSAPPQVRRKDKLMTDADAEAFLARGYCGRIATIGADGWPYCVPLLYVWADGEVLVHNPAARGQVVVLYGTGFGAVQAAQDSLRRTVQAVAVRGAGVGLPVVYAGLTPGAIGLYQLNVQLPADMPPGLFQAFEIREGGVTANPVTVAIR